MTAQMILALSIIVGIHEFGHLLTAKLFGMRVEKYFIGFPPKIWSFNYKGTEYGLGSIPLGGFVKISGIIDESMDTSHINKEPEPWEFRSKPAWQRLVVMLGGIIFNVITGLIIFTMITFNNGETYLSKDEINKPSLVIANTIIGFGSPNKAGTENAHGEPLGSEETELTKNNLGWNYKEFEVPKDVYDHMKEISSKGDNLEIKWNLELKNYKNTNPDKYKDLLQVKNSELPLDWDKEINNLIKETNEPEATRASSGLALNAISNSLDNLIGGSADLTGSTNTLIKNSENFSRKDPLGKNIKFGVREHGMGGVMNGISAYGSHRVFGGTFLVFSDYMRGSVRLSALSGLNSIWIFTHDSIGLGEDGPTHQPISQLMSLRSIPNLNVFRPADRRETILSWKYAILEKDKPSALIFSRQGLPDISTLSNLKIDSNIFSKGAYSVYKNTNDEPEIIFLSTGSELANTIQASKTFENDYSISVVSMPCWELFDKQDKSYKENLLPKNTKHIISIEAGIGLGWQKYTQNNDSIISIETFGASAPGNKLIDYFGFSTDKIIERVKKIIRN